MKARKSPPNFQKIIDHRGIALNRPIRAVAHLGFARAFAFEVDAAKSRAAYQDFLSFWMGDDSFVPILKQAKAEYARL
jgi:eukaryotic-like serine/threonine-protein kinase